MSFCLSGGHSEWLNCCTLSQGPEKFECILIWSPCEREKLVWWGTKLLVDLNKIKYVYNCGLKELTRIQNTYVEQYYKCSFGSSRESKADQILGCRSWVCLSLTNLSALKLWINKTKTSEMKDILVRTAWNVTWLFTAMADHSHGFVFISETKFYCLFIHLMKRSKIEFLKLPIKCSAQTPHGQRQTSREIFKSTDTKINFVSLTPQQL